MGLYNMLHGTNPASGWLLGLLDLTDADVGRFRDVFVEDEGKVIAVYTRNGGGNRGCVHDERDWNDGYVGNQACGGTSRTVEVDEYTRSGFIKKTGRRVMETQWTCPAPNSTRCGCYGCAIEHRLPKHPLYVSDSDDDFDCTYATIRFRTPEQVVPLLKDLSVGKFDPDARWMATLDSIKEGKRPEVLEAMRPTIEAIVQAVKA